MRPDGATGLGGAGTASGGSGRDPEHFWIAVGPYLRLTSADWGDSWRLVNRAVAGGEVRVSRDELLSALEAAVEERVAEGLDARSAMIRTGRRYPDAFESALAEAGLAEQFTADAKRDGLEGATADAEVETDF